MRNCNLNPYTDHQWCFVPHFSPLMSRPPLRVPEAAYGSQPVAGDSHGPQSPQSSQQPYYDEDTLDYRRQPQQFTDPDAHRGQYVPPDGQHDPFGKRITPVFAV